MDAKDVKISVSGDIFLIKGEKKEEEEEKDEDLHYVERSYGFFQRSFQLPNAIKAEDIEAKFDKGILKITLPKIDRIVKSPRIVVSDLIRHPQHIGITGFLLQRE